MSPLTAPSAAAQSPKDVTVVNPDTSAVRFHVEPATYANVWVEISRAAEGRADVEGSLSGYLVDAP